MPTIKNSKTNEVKEITDKQWEDIKKNELVKKSWLEVLKAKTPPEVQKIQEATAKDKAVEKK